VRKAAYDAELQAWPTVAVSCAAALNAVKGEANTVNRRRGWDSPLQASLFANNVSRSTFDAMQSAVDAALPDLRRWMRVKSHLHGHAGGLPWYDLFAPLPFAPPSISWSDGIGIVRGAFSAYSEPLGSLVDRALDEQWIDAGPRDGKRGGAFCMPFVDDRSLVFLNWSGSVDSAQTTAHELGHAYHNTQLAHRTELQRRMPMALAETASIFCETLVVEEGLRHLTGRDRLALLDVNLLGAVQTVVDIRSRVTFETEVFARRQRRTIGVSEFNEMMLNAQADAYGDGLDQSTAHPYMWAVKGHYYGSHFYNWPYTYGFLFGLGLFTKYRDDPQRFQQSYDDVLSRAGMNTAEELTSRRSRSGPRASTSCATTSTSTWIWRRRCDDLAVPTRPRRAGRTARRSAALSRRPDLAGSVPEPGHSLRDDQPSEGVAGHLERTARAGIASGRP
jgi:oligoendopeptidase F